MQDDWRVNNKLTLNLGLRYEVETALTERKDRSVSGFDFDYVQPIQATVQANYAALNDPALKALVPQLSVKGGLMFAGVDGGSRLYTTPKNTFLPRFGLRLPVEPQDGHPRRRRAVRRLPRRAARRRDPDRLLSDDHRRHHDQRLRGADPGDWDNAFLTTPILEPVGNANGRQTFLGQAISFFNQNPKVSKQLRWQIGFQRELPGGFVRRRRVRRQLRLRHRDHPQHQRPAEPVPEHGQLAHRRDERQQHVPDRRRSRTRSPGCCREPASTTRPSPARSCCARTRSSGTSPRRTTTASRGTTPASSACRSGSRRATRWASPTPTRSGCRRPST